MRLVHIADLHAGKTLGKVSRNPDLHHALAQIESFIRENRVDLVLIAGDVFDKANPDNESKELIFDFFLKLKEIGSQAAVVAGNHDSYDFMKSIRGISSLANVHIYDRPSSKRAFFTFGDLKIACLPYPSERLITSAGEDSKKKYAELVEKFIRFLAKGVEGAKYRILLAHLFVAGSVYTSTEKEATLSDNYAVQPSALSDGFDYVALGHVHKHQKLKGVDCLAYYVGTPYPLDFSEAQDGKFFNFILLEGDLPKVEAVPLSVKNPLYSFKLRQSEVLKKLPDLEELTGYIKVTIEVERGDTLGAVTERLRSALRERLLRVEFVFKEEKRSQLPKLSSLDPLSAYMTYYKSVHGGEMPQSVKEVFLELLSRAEG